MKRRRFIIQLLAIGVFNLLIAGGSLVAVKIFPAIFIMVAAAILIFLIDGLILYFTGSNSTAQLREVNRVLERFNKGDFTARFQTEKFGKEGREVSEQIDLLRNTLNNWIYELLHSSVSVKASALEITAGTERTTEGMEELNTSLEEISQSFEETTAMLSLVSNSAEDLLRSGLDIARSSTEVEASVRQAKEAAREGGDTLIKMTEAMTAMETEVTDSYNRILHLEEVSKQIGGITDTISAISRQTNMLALNASIESARAGEQGKGFAVVADEVRKLSEETRAAANRINELIDAVQQEVKEAVITMEAARTKVSANVEIAGITEDNLKNIIHITEKALVYMETISKDAREQAEKTNIISGNTYDVAEKGHNGTASVQEISCVMEVQAEDIRKTNSTTHKLLGISEKLERVMERFDSSLGEQMLQCCDYIAELEAEGVKKDNPLTDEDFKRLTDKYHLSEIHITDENGIIIFSTCGFHGFQFSNQEGSQTFEFTKILRDPSHRVNQRAEFRDTDGKLFKYAGVSLRGRTGIVQCGLDASTLTEFTEPKVS